MTRRRAISPDPKLIQTVREYLQLRRGGRYSANNLARVLNTKPAAVLSALEVLRAAGELKTEHSPPSGCVYFMPIEAMPELRRPWTRGELTGWETQLRQRMATCMAAR